MHCQDSFIFQQSFNPRTREGATQAITSLNYGPQSFNPRTREGATLLMWFGLVPKQSFNPRTREGATAWRIRVEHQGRSKGFAPT